MFILSPTVLTTDKIKLIPLTLDHHNDYYLAGNSTELWRWIPTNPCINIESAKAWLTTAVAAMKKGEQLAFMIFDIASNSYVGSTRLFKPNKKDASIEIGHTFIQPEFQRSYVNTHAKYLLLRHSFEQLLITRVEFCTHEHNEKSCNAIVRIGGKFEGVLRKHRRLSDGSYRNTTLFSITDDEWPQIKEQLESKI